MKEEKKLENLEEVVYVSWEESERGWGTRPDGCSLHLTKEDFKEYLRKYWFGMPDEVPDEYSRPAGRPVKACVSKTLYEKIKESDYGIRLWKFEEIKEVENKNLVYGSEKSGWVMIKKEIFGYQ